MSSATTCRSRVTTGAFWPTRPSRSPARRAPRRGRSHAAAGAASAGWALAGGHSNTAAMPCKSVPVPLSSAPMPPSRIPHETFLLSSPRSNRRTTFRADFRPCRSICLCCLLCARCSLRKRAFSARIAWFTVGPNETDGLRRGCFISGYPGESPPEHRLLSRCRSPSSAPEARRCWRTDTAWRPGRWRLPGTFGQRPKYRRR